VTAYAAARQEDSTAIEKILCLRYWIRLIAKPLHSSWRPLSGYCNGKRAVWAGAVRRNAGGATFEGKARRQGAK
jgi:hypothetical protein